MATLQDQRIQYEARLKALLEGFGGIIGESTISVSRLSIINYVKAKLDELLPEAEGLTFSLSSEPNVSAPYDMLIDSHLDEGAKDIILSAPLNVLTPTPLAGTAVYTPAVGQTPMALNGYIELPANFLRLSSFKMTDWKREVNHPITTTHPDYKKQSTVLRGGPHKPVAVLNWKNTTTGGIKTITLALSGTGYTVGVNTLVVTQAGAVQGTIKVTAGATGIVTSVDSIQIEGAGYSVANALATTGTGTGCTVNITAINGLKKILEYYSVDTLHTIEKLFYIPETKAENLVLVNSNLLPSLAWMVAGKVMQILGLHDNYKLAMEQVQHSYVNL